MLDSDCILKVWKRESTRHRFSVQTKTEGRIRNNSGDSHWGCWGFGIEILKIWHAEQQLLSDHDTSDCKTMEILEFTNNPCVYSQDFICFSMELKKGSKLWIWIGDLSYRQMVVHSMEMTKCLRNSVERGERRIESWQIKTLTFVPNEKELRIKGPRNNSETERSQWIAWFHERGKYHQCHFIPSKRTVSSYTLCNGRVLKIYRKQLPRVVGENGKRAFRSIDGRRKNMDTPCPVTKMKLTKRLARRQWGRRRVSLWFDFSNRIEEHIFRQWTNR